jgi:putative nucleotidyltransferase with HDIG domain
MKHLQTTIPSVEECFRLMDSHQMLPNIREHSIVVARIAAFLTQSLTKVGIHLVMDMVIAGALLHDIGKTACLNKPENHAAKGREICQAENFDGIGDIVAEHVILKNYSPDMDLSEKVIVYYADKRVNHDQVVSLDDRLAYIIRQYGNGDSRLQKLIRKNFNRCVVIENKIFSFLKFQPADIARLIRDIEIKPTATA